MGWSLGVGGIGAPGEEMEWGITPESQPAIEKPQKTKKSIQSPTIATNVVVIGIISVTLVLPGVHRRYLE